RRASEIDEPVDDRRNAWRLGFAPDGQDLAETVDQENRDEQNQQAADDQGGAQQQQVSGKQRKQTWQVGTGVGASGRGESGVCRRHAQHDQRYPEDRERPPPRCHGRTQSNRSQRHQYDARDTLSPNSARLRHWSSVSSGRDPGGRGQITIYQRIPVAEANIDVALWATVGYGAFIARPDELAGSAMTNSISCNPALAGRKPNAFIRRSSETAPMKPSIYWLFVFVPITVILEHVGKVPPPVIFFSAALAIVPIAVLIVRSTEQIAARTGDAVGGLLNATFGNAPELIIALVALKAGYPDMVRASIIGGILANLLLALGVAFFLGGIRHRDQKYNPAAARIYSSMMLLAAASLAVPSAFSRYFAPEGTI